MIQYIKPSCWEWIRAELRQKNHAVYGGFHYYVSQVYECKGVYRHPVSQTPDPNFDELVAYYGKDEF